MGERCPPPLVYRYGILYLGTNLDLLLFLQRELKAMDCFVSYVPLTSLAHAFIKTNSKYHLLMFDAQMPETTGAELVEFARTVPHRARTPCIVCACAESRPNWAST